LALGLLVDNAIVVVENIYRFVDNGYEPFKAARLAVGEIAIPIIASTATTLAVFFPLMIWEGIMGEFMKYLPLTLIVVLSSSLFVALVIIPVISATFIKVKNGNNGNNSNNVQSVKQRRMGLYLAIGLIGFGGLLLLTGARLFPNLLILLGIIGLLNLLFLRHMESWFQEIFLVKLEKWYSATLKYALSRKRLLYFFFGTIALLIITIMLYFRSQPETLYFPDSDPNYVNIICELPTGTDITATNEFALQLEEDIIDFLEPNKDVIESVLSTVGKGDPMDFSAGAKPNELIVIVSFVDYELRGTKSTSKLMREMTDHFHGKYPGVELEIAKEDNGPPSTYKDINLEVIGDEFDRLVYLTDTIKSYLESQDVDGVEGLKMDISTQKPELIINLDRDKAQRFGLNTQQVAFTLRQALFGEQVSDFKVGEDEYPIQVRLKDEYRYNLSTLMNMKMVVFGDGPPAYIPLSSVADFEYSTTFSSVRRKNLKRVITLESNVIEGYNVNSVNQQLATAMESFEMPAGYTYAFTGEQQDQAEDMAFMGRAMLIGLAIILLILVTQFNSIIRPAIILVSVLFSTIGVFGGLWTFNMNFVVIMTGIGIISLAGIVVNNAIVLIDYIEQLKKRKRVELGLAEGAYLPIEAATECIIEGGKTRLRPVLLTAITTVMGLMPMAVGLNFDFNGLFTSYEPNIYFGGIMASMWQPMSWTVIFGLTFSTFLTLVIVPVMYRMTTLAQKRINSIVAVFKDKREVMLNNMKE
jgi:multidrug efflux pump subunit AcrB